MLKEKCSHCKEAKNVAANKNVVLKRHNGAKGIKAIARTAYTHMCDMFFFYSPHNVRCLYSEVLGRGAGGRWTKAQTKKQPSLSKHEHEQSFISTNLLVWKTHKKCINSRRCTTQKSHHHKHTYTCSIVLGSILLGSVSFSSFHSFKRLFCAAFKYSRMMLIHSNSQTDDFTAVAFAIWFMALK